MPVYNIKILRTILLLLCYNGFSAYAQNYITNIRHLSVEDGLASRVVNCGMQDSRGFVWLGTKTGLNRYDGNGFALYTKVGNGMQSNEVLKMVEDDNGFIWLFYAKPGFDELFDGKVDLINVKTWEIQPLSKEISDKTGLTENNLTFVVSGSKGELFLYFDNGNVLIYSARNNSLISSAIPEGITENAVAGTNGVWSGGREGSLTYTTCKGDARTFELPEIKLPYPVFADKDDNVHLLSAKEYKPDLCVVNNQLVILSKTGSTTPSPETLATASVPLGPVDKVRVLRKNTFNGQLWLSVEEQGVFMYPENEEVQTIIGKAGLEEAKGIRAVKDLFFTRSSAWFCTVNGVFVIEARPNNFKHYLLPLQDVNNQVRGLQEDGKGHLMIADISGFHSVRLDNGNENKLPDIFNNLKYAFKFLQEKDKLWIASNDLYEFNIKTNKRIGFYGFKEDAHSNKDWVIWDMYRSKTGKLWLATAQGLAFADEEKEVITIPANSVFKNTSDNPVYQFYKTQNGEIWLPSNNGIYRFDEEKGMVDHHSENEKGTNYLPVNKACYIHEDSQGVFWIATLGYGLLQWDRKQNTFELYTVNDGLSSNVLYTILEDADNNLWLGSDYGLMKFNKSTHQVKTYTRRDGLSDNEFDRISALKAADGRMYFGTMRGVNAFYPSDFKGDSISFSAALQVTEFSQFSGAKDKLEERTTDFLRNGSITLNHGDVFFTLTVQLLDFSEAKHNYAYKIEGLDNDWNYIQQNTVRLSNLPYGVYNLKIKAQDISGYWSKSQLSIPLTVLAPFYLNVGFIALAVFGLVAAVYVYFRFRTRGLRKAREHLEQTVAERTAELNKALNQSEVLLKEIHHRVKNNLQIIGSLLDLQSSRLEDNEAKAALEESKGRIQSIAILHHQLYQHDDLGKVELNAFTTELMRQVMSIFKKMEQAVEVQIDIPPTMIDIDTAVPLGLILNELMTNSFKHAFEAGKQGTIGIKLEQEIAHTGSKKSSSGFILTFSDNGKGLIKDFDFGKATSLGLRLIGQLSKQIKGSSEYIYKEGAEFKIAFRTS